MILRAKKKNGTANQNRLSQKKAVEPKKAGCVCVCLCVQTGAAGALDYPLMVCPRAWAWYCADVPSPPGEEEHPMIATLGSGTVQVPSSDPRVVELARGMHESWNSITPRQAHAYAALSTTEADAVGNGWSIEEVAATADPFPTCFHQPGPSRARQIPDLACLPWNLVREYGSPQGSEERERPLDQDVGHGRVQLAFSGRRHRTLAEKVLQHHSPVSAQHVCELLLSWCHLDSSSAGCQVDFQQEASLEGRTPLGTWQSICAGIRAQHRSLKEALQEWDVAVFLDQRRTLSMAKLVACHWSLRASEEGADLLQHKVCSSCTLSCRIHATSGVSLELEYEPLVQGVTPWPWWMDSRVRYVPSLLRQVGEDTGQRDRKRHRELYHELQQTGQRVQSTYLALHPSARQVLHRWKKSLDLADSCPLLLGDAIPLDMAGDSRWMENSDTDSALLATRVGAEDEVLIRLMKVTLSEGYVTSTLDSAKQAGPCTGLFLVEEDAAAVGYFIVYLYDCLFSDGEKGVSACIEAFGVDPTLKAKSYGGRIYRGLLLYWLRQRSSRFVVFAQCLRTRDAKLFWNDKLDESSNARSLLLQALSFAPERFHVQPETQCSARAREHYDWCM